MSVDQSISRLSQWDPPSGIEAAARAGVRQTTAIRLGSLVVQFVSAALLARLLGPSAFGVVAVATLVTGFATIFNDMGIGSAIVQRPSLDEETLTSAFWLNAGVGLALTVLISASTPLWVMFFHQSQLAYVLPVASLTMVLSVSLVQKSLLQRSMNFKAVMGLDFLYGILSSAVSVLLVVVGVGVIAIPIGAIVGTAVSSIVAFRLCPCWPVGRPSLEAIKALWSYSASVLGFNIVNYIGKNLDNVLVGRFLGSAALGYYSRAYNLMQLPVVNLTRVLGTVLFPALASTRGATKEFRRAWVVSSRASLLVGLWVGAVVATCARDLVPILYGDQWNPMANSLAVLMISVPAFVLASNASAVFLALGATKLQFRLGLATLAIRVVGILAGVQSGYFGVAVAVAVTGYLTMMLNVGAALRLAEISVAGFLRAIGVISMAGALAVAAGLGASRGLLSVSSVLSLVLTVAATTTVYVGVILLLDHEALSLGRKKSVRSEETETVVGRHRQKR